MDQFGNPKINIQCAFSPITFEIYVALYENETEEPHRSDEGEIAAEDDIGNGTNNEGTCGGYREEKESIKYELSVYPVAAVAYRKETRRILRTSPAESDKLNALIQKHEFRRRTRNVLARVHILDLHGTLRVPAESRAR